MKKFIVLALIGLGCVGVCVVYTQDETVQELVGKLRQFPQRAAEWCPQLCTLQAVDENIEAAVCGFCYESCPSGGMMAQCQNKNYAQPLKRARAQVSIYKKAMEQLAKGVRVSPGLWAKYKSEKAAALQRSLEVEQLQRSIESNQYINKIYRDIRRQLRKEKRELAQKVEHQQELIAMFKSVLQTVELDESCQLFLKKVITPGNGLEKIARDYFSFASRIKVLDSYQVRDVDKKFAEDSMEVITNIIKRLDEYMQLPKVDSLCRNSIKFIFKDIYRIESVLKNLSTHFSTVGNELDRSKFAPQVKKLKEYVDTLYARVGNLADVDLVKKMITGAAPVAEQGLEIVEYPEGGSIILAGKSVHISPDGSVIMNPDNSVIIMSSLGSIQSLRKLSAGDMKTFKASLAQATQYSESTE